MKGFDGAWTCDTKFPANAMGPGTPEVIGKSTVKFKKELGGMFWRGDYVVKKQKGIPMNFSGILYVGWDPGANQALLTAVDSTGGVVTETGKIEGDTVNLTGDGWMMGQKIKVKESMGKKSPKEAWHKFEVDMGHGWMPMGEDSCKK